MMSDVTSSAVASSALVCSNCVIDMIVKSSARFIYIGWTF